MDWVGIGLDNGLTPIRHLNQCLVIVNWTLRNKRLGNCDQNIKISFMKMHLKISSVKWQPFCPAGDELMRRELGYLRPILPQDELGLIQAVAYIEVVTSRPIYGQLRVYIGLKAHIAFELQSSNGSF